MKTEFIAEIGGNHKGDFELAKELVYNACASDADIIKLQLYTASGLVNAKYDPQRHEHFKKFELQKSEYIYLAEKIKSNGKKFCASIWDVDMFDWIIPYLDVLKIGSGDFTYLPLIKELLKLDKELILSTGLCYQQEVDEVISFIQKNTTPSFFKEKVTLMQCTSMYPIPENEANLNVIENFKKTYNCKTGYSDHTLNIHALKIAIAMGVNSVEFHYTLDRADSSFRDNLVSLELSDVRELRIYDEKVKLIKGSSIKCPTKSEINHGHINSFRRGCYASRKLKKGEIISHKDIVFLRPFITNSINPMIFKYPTQQFEILMDIDYLEVLSEEKILKL